MPASKAGFVMVGVMMLIVVAAIAAGGFMFSARQSLPVVNRWHTYDDALLAAQTGLERVKSNLYDDFRDYHKSTYSWNNIYWVEEQATNYAVSGPLWQILGTNTAGNYVAMESNLPYSNAVVDITVTNEAVDDATFEERSVSITVTAEAVYEGMTRKIKEVFVYKLSKSTVFDYAYFMNNFGWWYGVNIVVNGDIRSNYDMALRSDDLVINGQTYAAGLNNVLKPFSTWNSTTYLTDGGHADFRPFYHVDQNYSNTNSLYEMGYDYTDSGNIYDGVEPLEMPYIGTLSDFEEYARDKNGTISQGGTVLISNVWSGTGPSGITNAPDEGCFVLEGTLADPIVIDGPVVVREDLLIKGYYTGQGTIYAGRNVHVLDNLIAVNPPAWNHPDTVTNFNNNTLPDNLDADFLGLCSKGSIILGDYNQDTWILNYAQPPFTQPYEVSVTDADIGYAQYQVGDDWYFDGDYTAIYGEKSSDADPAVGVDRRYYQTSVSEAMFAALSPARRITHIDGFIYNNHITTGGFNEGVVNGGIICRDEALLVNGPLYMNWDSRISSDTDFKPYLPMELTPANTITWLEMTP